MTTFDATVGAQVTQQPVNASVAGDNIIIPGLAGQVIRVLQFFAVFSGATTITYKSGSSALSGPMILPGAAGQVQDFIQLPLTCNAGDSFIINNSNGVTVGGTIWFIQAKP